MAELPDVEEFEVEELVSDLRDRATDNAPTTVTYTWGGVLVGAAVLGPIGGVAGAALGSGIGYLVDEGYVGSAEDPGVVEADVEY